MKRLTHVLLMTVACGAIGVSPARAQMCMGQNPTAVGEMRGGGQVNFASETHGLSGGVAKQYEQFFGGGGIIIEGVSGIDSAKGFYLSGGTERTVGPDKKYFVCPLVQLFKFWGPHPSPETSLSTWLFDFGGLVGFEAATRGTTKIVPTAGFSLNFARSSRSGDAFEGSFTETIASLQAGVGLLFNEKTSLTPMMIFDLNADEIDPTFAVIFSTKFGKK